MTNSHFDCVIIGAGAAGMMCAAKTGKNGKSVLLIDHAKKPGEKIRISGGGRCNFTNINCGPENFISNNPHFAKSALASYSPHDFIALVEQYGIRWHEKALGQLFCDGRSQQIIDMLDEECKKANVQLWLETSVLDIRKSDAGYAVTTSRKSVTCQTLIIACGGPSIPKMGASGYGYKIATQFNIPVIDPVAALVPLIFTDSLKDDLSALSGLSLEARVTTNTVTFTEALLFTHRGLSGPSILQISSYWQPGEQISIDFAPGHDIEAMLLSAKTETPKHHPQTILARHLPKRLADVLSQGKQHKKMADMSHAEISALAMAVQGWRAKPAGTEGFRTAEVTKGGVDTNALSSKTMECKTEPGLYFIGEVVDVTGHLGGHNFQWAWASATACARALTS